MVQNACGPRSPPPHLLMSLVAKSPLRDLLKWNIWFHFEVPKHLNHLARKDAGRVVKLLCLAAGSPSANGEHKGEERYRPGTLSLPAVVFLFSVEPRCDVTVVDKWMLYLLFSIFITQNDVYSGVPLSSLGRERTTMLR